MTTTDLIAAAAITQATATLALVSITAWYAFRIREQAEAAAESAEATRRSAEASEQLAALTAPGVREQRMDALVRIQEIADVVDRGAKALQGHRTHDDLNDLFGQGGDSIANADRKRSLVRLGVRVGGDVEDKMWAVWEAINSFDETVRDIRSRRSGDGMVDLDPIAFSDAASDVRTALAHLETAVTRVMERRQNLED